MSATEEEKAARYAELLQEELGKPMRYFFHDVDAHEDEKLEELRDAHGFDALGRWWLLAEILAGRQWHRLETRRTRGWERLARLLEYDTREQAQEFVGWLVELDLLDRESYERDGYVRSERMDRNAYQMAESAASKRLGAWAKQQAKRQG